MGSEPVTDTEMNQTFDIAIVGAGMVGAALAVGLAREDFKVALIDRDTLAAFDPASPPDLRVSALSAGSERLLRHWGAWGAIESMRLCPYRRLAVWETLPTALSRWLPRRFNRTLFDATRLGRSHLGHIVENSVTQSALWQAARDNANVTLIQGHEVRHLEQAPDAATLQLDDNRRIGAPLVIGADGARSRLRDMARIGVNRDQYAQQALVATVAHEGAAQDITWQAFHASGPRAYLPLAADGDTAWASLVWYDQPDRIKTLLSMSDTDFMAAVQQAFPEELPPLRRVSARGSFPLFRSHAQRYFSGRVVLAGDAAHTINPLAGQGVNLGFQDADALIRQLVEARGRGQDPGSADVLAAYERTRRPANQRMMLAMDLFYHAFSNQRPPLHLARNLGLAIAGHLPFARDEVARYAMGLDDGLSARLLRWLDQRLPALPIT